MTATINARTPKGAAGATLRAIRTLPGGEYAFVRPTEHGSGWAVVWEEGPYEWTIIATGPGDIYAEEMGGTLVDAYQRNKPTFDFSAGDSNNWFPEPQNHYALNFWKIR